MKPYFLSRLLSYFSAVFYSKETSNFPPPTVETMPIQTAHQTVLPTIQSAPPECLAEVTGAVCMSEYNVQSSVSMPLDLPRLLAADPSASLWSSSAVSPLGHCAFLASYTTGTPLRPSLAPTGVVQAQPGPQALWVSAYCRTSSFSLTDHLYPNHYVTK